MNQLWQLVNKVCRCNFSASSNNTHIIPILRRLILDLTDLLKRFEAGNLRNRFILIKVTRNAINRLADSEYSYHNKFRFNYYLDERIKLP